MRSTRIGLLSHARAKLASQEGASILYALVLLVVVGVITAIIVSASLSSLQRVTDDYDHQQAQLSLDSAAKAFRDELGASSCQQQTTYVLVTAKDGSQTRTNEAVGRWSAGEGGLGALLAEAMETAETTKYAKHDITITADGFDDVDVSFTMMPDKELFADVETSYAINVVFSLEGANGITYRATLNVTPQDRISDPYVVSSSKKGSVTYATTTTRQWFAENATIASL